METENKNMYWAVIVIAVIIGLIILSFIYFSKDLNNGQLFQSQQDQCATKAKEKYDSVVAEFTQKNETKYGIGTTDTYDYSSHYNKSMGACIMFLHEVIAQNITQMDIYLVLNIDDKLEIGTLYYDTIGATKNIRQCVVNSLPCNSLEEYTKLTTPYLNN